MKNKIITYSFSLALVFLLPMFLMQVLPSLFGLAVVIATGNDGNSLLLWCSVAASFFTVGCSIWLIHKAKPQEFSLQVPKFYILFAVFVILFLFLFADQILSTWILNHVSDPGMAQRTAALETADLEQNLWLYIVYALLVAPVAEEFLFRIALYPYLKKVMSWIPAMFLTAISFGAIHMTTVHLVTATLFGVLLVLIMERTGCIWITIVGHIFYNMAVLLVDSEQIARLSAKDGVVFLVAFGMLLLLSGYIARQDTLRELREWKGD